LHSLITHIYHHRGQRAFFTSTVSYHCSRHNECQHSRQIRVNMHTRRARDFAQARIDFGDTSLPECRTQRTEDDDTCGHTAPPIAPRTSPYFHCPTSLEHTSALPYTPRRKLPSPKFPNTIFTTPSRRCFTFPFHSLPLERRGADALIDADFRRCYYHRTAEGDCSRCVK
jgi:hypothetical protein